MTMAQYLSQRIEDSIFLEPSDISFLRTSISEAQTGLQTLENQLDEVGARIPELTRQKDVKLVEIASLRNILAPVRRLPFEILSEVFILSCNHYVSRDHDLIRHRFILTSVCVAWRKAAHAIPRLWSTMCILLRKHRLGSDLSWVEDWIARCQTIALDLHLDLTLASELHNPEPRHVIESMARAGKQLLAHILLNFGHKIRFLGIAGHLSSFIPLLLQQDTLLALEEVSFKIEEGYDDRQTRADLLHKQTNVFSNAPKLHQVEINNAFLLRSLVLPAQQLTSLTLVIYDSDEDDLAFYTIDIFVLLPQCSKLVSLKIGLPYDFQYSTEADFILLPALKTLIVYCIGTADNILSYITAPLLESLTLHHGSEHMDSLVDDLNCFQQRSVTALSYLAYIRLRSLGEVDSIVEGVITLLSLFPTIHTLDIRPDLADLDPLIQALTCTVRGSGDNVQLLPNLIDLTLNGYRSYFTASRLKTMVLSRWWSDEAECDGLVSVRNGMSRLQKVTLKELLVKGRKRDRSTEDIMDISSLSGLVVNCTRLLMI